MTMISGLSRPRRAAALTAMLLGAASSAAIAQTAPSGVTLSDSSNVKGTVASGGLSPVIIDGRTQTSVNLLARNTIIDWNGFNIPERSRIDFNALSSLIDVAVLNRDTSGKVSNLLGQLTSDRNVSVWVLNPTGIIVGPRASLSTGSLVLTTLDVNADDFANASGTVRMSGAANSLSAISVANGARIAVEGGARGLVMVAPQIDSAGSVDANGGNVAFVAASDVTLNYTNGSPLSVTINRGTAVPGRSNFVRGTVEGNSAIFALASQATITDALLQVSGDVTTATSGPRGIVLSAGRDVAGVTLAGGAETAGTVALNVGGELRAGTGGDIAAGASGTAAFLDRVTGRNVTLGSLGTMSVTGNVAAAGALDLSGGGVTLGGSSPVTQSAGATLAVRSTGGNIVGMGALTLRSGASGADSLLLATDGGTAGDIRLGTASRLIAGDAARGTLTLRLRDAGNAVVLGDVSAGALRGAVAGGATENGLRLASAVTLGDVALRDALGVQAETVTIGQATTGAGITLVTGQGPLTAGALTAVGDVRLTSVGGAIGTGAITSGAAVSVASGGNLTAASVAGSGPVTLSSAGAMQVVGALTAAGTLTAQAGGALTLANVTSGTDVTLTSGGTARIAGAVEAGGNYQVTGSSIDLGGGVVQRAGGSIRLTASAGDISGGSGLSLVSRGAAGSSLILDAAGQIAMLGTELRGAAVPLALRAGSGRAIRLGTVDVAAIGGLSGTEATDRLVHDGAFEAGNITAGRISIALSAGDLTTGGINSPGAVAISAATGAVSTGAVTAGSVEARAGGALTMGATAATGGVTLDAASITLPSATGGTLAVRTAGTFGAASGGRAALRTTAGDLSVDAGSARLADVASAGGLTLRGEQIDAGPVSAAKGLSAEVRDALTLGDASAGTDMTLKSGGALTAGNATAGGGITLDGSSITLASATGNTLTVRTAGTLGGVGGGRAALRTIAGDLSVSAGDARLGAVVSAGALTLGGGQIDVASVRAARALTGDVRTALTLGEATAGADMMLRPGGALTVGEATAAGALTLDGPSINLGSATGGTLAVRTAGAIGGVGGGRAALRTTAGDLSVDAGSARLADVASAGILTLRGGQIDAGPVSAAKGLSAEVRDALTLGDASAGTDMALKSGGALTIGNATAAGGITLDGPSIALVSATAGTLTVRTAGALGGIGGGRAALRTTAGDLLVDAGSARLGAVASAGALALRGGQVDAGSVSAARGLTGEVLTTLTLGDTTAGTDMTLKSGGALTIGNATAAGGITLDGPSITLASASGSTLAVRTAGALGGAGGGRAALRTTAGDLSVDAGVATLGDVASAGTLTLRAAALDAGRLTAARGIGADVRGTFASGDAAAGGDLSLKSGGTLSTGTLAGGGIVLDGAGVSVGATTARGALSATSRGALSIASATATTGVTLDATGTATLGALSGGPSVTLTAADAALSGSVRATAVTFATKAPAMTALRLGDGTAAGGFRLSDAEVAQVAADTLRFDAASGALEVGTLNLGPAAGRSIEMLSTGDVRVTGPVRSTTEARSVRLGGDRSGGSAATIHLVSTSSAGGRLLLDGADVELRGDRIAAGFASGFLDTLQPGAAGQLQARALIGDPNSPLYNPLLGGLAYAPDATTTLSARSLTVRFADYALFQNTGVGGNTSGVVLGGTGAAAVIPALRATTTGNPASAVLALFGTINGLNGSGTAVAGLPALAIDTGLLPNTRINGCLAGSLAGCLTTVAIQPTLQVFDWDSQVVFGIAQDVSVPFAPIVAGNNEELLSDLPELFPATPVRAGGGPPIIALPPAPPAIQGVRP